MKQKIVLFTGVAFVFVECVGVFFYHYSSGNQVQYHANTDILKLVLDGSDMDVYAYPQYTYMYVSLSLFVPERYRTSVTKGNGLPVFEKWVSPSEYTLYYDGAILLSKDSHVDLLQIPNSLKPLTESLHDLFSGKSIPAYYFMQYRLVFYDEYSIAVIADSLGLRVQDLPTPQDKRFVFKLQQKPHDRE